jgi:hypothetical protein
LPTSDVGACIARQKASNGLVVAARIKINREEIYKEETP